MITSQSAPLRQLTTFTACGALEMHAAQGPARIRVRCAVLNELRRQTSLPVFPGAESPGEEPSFVVRWLGLDQPGAAQAWSLQSAWGKPAKQGRRAGSDSLRAFGTLRAVIQPSLCVSLMARSCQGAGINGLPLQPQQRCGRAYAICLADSAAEQAPQKRYRFGPGLPACAMPLEGPPALSRDQPRPRPAGRSAEQPRRFGHNGERQLGALGDVEQGNADHRPD